MVCIYDNTYMGVYYLLFCVNLLYKNCVCVCAVFFLSFFLFFFLISLSILFSFCIIPTIFVVLYFVILTLCVQSLRASSGKQQPQPSDPDRYFRFGFLDLGADCDDGKDAGDGFLLVCFTFLCCCCCCCCCGLVAAAADADEVDGCGGIGAERY